MSRRQLIAAFVLAALIAGAGGTASVLWRQQERAALARAALPALPDLVRWPAELEAGIKAETAAVRTAENPVPALGRLAALYLANGFVGEARPLLEALRRLEPRNARWARLLAEAHRRAGDRAASEEALLTVVRLDPLYTPAWLALGDAFRERQALDRAEECYRQAVVSGPGDVRAEYALIAFEAWHGRRVDPRRSLAALCEAHPGIRELHELHAQLLEAAGEKDRAAAERRLAALADRQLANADPWLEELLDLCQDPSRLGLAAHRFGLEKRMVLAEKLLRRTARLSPADPTPRKALADLYRRNDRLADAHATLQAALAECPHDPGVPVALSALLCLAHRPFEAAAIVRTALQRWPQRGELHAALGHALREAREPEEAVPVLREAIRLDPTSVAAYCDLGFCLLSLRRTEEARAAIERALAIRPTHAESLVLIGRLTLENGEFAEAERHIVKLHELDPDEPGSRLLYSALHLAKGRAAEEARQFDEADRLYRLGLEASPEFATLLRTAASLAARRAEYGRMADLLERYLRIVPRDLEVYPLLSDAYREIERPDDEERALERGLAMAGKIGNRAKIDEFNALIESLY